MSIHEDNMSPKPHIEIHSELRRSQQSSSSLIYLQKYIPSQLSCGEYRSPMDLDTSFAAAYTMDTGKSGPYPRENGGTKGS